MADNDADKMLNLFRELDDSPKIREGFRRAPFGYPGGKSRSISELLQYLPYRSSYIEPFGGSGAVLIAREPVNLEVFNDRFAGVVTFYRCVRNKELCDKLIQRLELCVHAREEFVYCRDTWENVTDDVERAARWYYMLQTSFGNQGRHFGRATAGKAQMGNKVRNNLRLFSLVHNRFKTVQVENQDWKQCITDFDNNDAVFYMDPPYVQYSKGMYKHEMNMGDHERLLKCIMEMEGFVALSGYENELYDSFDWDQRVTWKVHVSMTGLAFHEENKLAGHEDHISRGKATEVLWIKEARD